MKKNLFIIVAVLLVITTKAQITLTLADFGNTSFHAIQANDTLIDTAAIHIGGTGNQTWNFAGLHNHNTDTLQFMTVASTPYSSSFNATANIAFTQSNNPLVYAFLNASNSGVNIIGEGLNNGYTTLQTPNEAVPLNPPQVYMPFPSTYNSGFSGSSNAVIMIDTTFVFSMVTVDSVRIRHFVSDTSLIDAWGSVTTPLGTFPSLRQKYIEHTVDSIDFYVPLLSSWNNAIQQVDSNLTYRWFANGQGFPLVEITMNKAWTQDSSADWIMSSNTAVPELVSKGSSIVLYPNPASTQINIMNTGNETSYLFVYDVMGRLINTIQLRDKITSLSTTDYAAGLYTYRVLNTDNFPVATGKFNIIK